MAYSQWSVGTFLSLGSVLSVLLVTQTLATSLSTSQPEKVIVKDTALEQPAGPFLSPETACGDGECDFTSVRPDVVLMKVCEYEIRTFCLQLSVYNVLGCLVEASADEKRHMSLACRKETQVQQWMLSKDFRSGPQAHPACASDVRRLCRAQDREADSARRMRTVTACLEKNLARQQLTANCEAYMMVYMREGSLDYRKDVPFAFECETEIRRHCQYAVPKPTEDQRAGQVAECLKQKFLAHFISDPICSEQVITSLQASRAEPRTDPLLYASCYRDLRMRCGDVLPGGGRQVTCLLSAVDARVKMELQCLHMLRRRLAMWRFGAMVSPRSFPEYRVRRSVSHFLFVYINYIVAAGALLLAFVLSVFLVLIIGKRRRMKMRKNVHYIQIEQAK